jgi:hypothetical protein
VHRVIWDSSEAQPRMGELTDFFFSFSMAPTVYGERALSPKDGGLVKTLCKIEVGPSGSLNWNVGSILAIW